MHVSNFKQSKFLTRHDCGNGILVTIKNLYQTNVAMEGAPEELRWALEFEESEKPLICNGTNAQMIAAITKSEETSDWTGHKIVLYDDPNVSFGGRLVGGIRVRAPRNQGTKPVQQNTAKAPVKPALTKPAPARPAPRRAEPEPEPELDPQEGRVEEGDDSVPF